MHSCPECGKLTRGAISEGGCRWAICHDCLNELIEEGRRMCEEPDPPGGYGICKETGCKAQDNIDGWE